MNGQAKGKRILAVYQGVNVQGNDARGAFIPQSLGYQRAMRAAGAVCDRVALESMPRGLIPYLRTMPAGAFDAFAYFGHGTRRALSSAGVGLAAVDALADATMHACKPGVRVVLYACSTAAARGPDRDALSGDGGFADRYRDAISVRGAAGGWIDAHTVPGHTTINRMTRRFLTGAPAMGGEWIVAPGSPLWGAWGRALKADRAFRYGFPLWDAGEIHAYLQSTHNA